MSVRRWYYFGCGRSRRPGHYLFEVSGQSANQALPGVRRLECSFDGVLAPRPDEAANLYVASFTRLHGLGCCAISWWDRSVDTRPGSNSIIFSPGVEWTAHWMLDQAKLQFPWVFERLPRPVRLLEPGDA